MEFGVNSELEGVALGMIGTLREKLFEGKFYNTGAVYQRNSTVTRLPFQVSCVKVTSFLSLLELKLCSFECETELKWALWRQQD